MLLRVALSFLPPSVWISQGLLGGLLVSLHLIWRHLFAPLSTWLILMLQRVSWGAIKVFGVSQREKPKKRSNRRATHPEERFDNAFLARDALVTEAGSVAILCNQKEKKQVKSLFGGWFKLPAWNNFLVMQAVKLWNVSLVVTLESRLETLRHLQNLFWQKWLSKLVLGWDGPLGDLFGLLLSVWIHSLTWRICHYPRCIVFCSSDYHLSPFAVYVCVTHSIK